MKAPHSSVAQRYRPEFPIFREKIYLNSCSLSPLAERCARALGTFTDLWHAWGAAAWYEIWLNKLEDLRARYARLLGAEPRELAFAPSVSTALTALTSALDFAKRPKVVVTELDFPTLAYQFLAKQRLGVEVVSLPSDDGLTVDLGRFEDAVDERTAVVATSHVYFTTGAIQNVEAVAEIARRRGAFCLIDAYQSIGQVPFDAKTIGADAVVGGALKWLLGGPGLAFLSVREDRIPALEPTAASWFGVDEQFAFDPKRFRLRSDARRFEMGTPALAAVYTASAGLEIIEEVGLSVIRERIAGLVADLVERARAAGLEARVAPRPEDRSGIVRIEHRDPAGVVQHLMARSIICDHRPGAVRISPHFYNTTEDSEAVVAALSRL